MPIEEVAQVPEKLYIVALWVQIIGMIVMPFVIAIGIWCLGRWSDDRKLKADAIRDLMTYRGDYSSPDFRKALNKVSIVFHNKEKIRLEIRDVYNIINGGIPDAEQKKRSIIGLIYNLCQLMGYKRLTEYDIDQSFVTGSGSQAPDSSLDAPRNQQIPQQKPKKKRSTKRKSKAKS